MKKNNYSIFEDALLQLNRYIEEAKQFGNTDSNCCFLATAGTNNSPSVRVITIQKIDESRLLFLTNTNSGKTKQFQENPAVGLCFYWPEIHVQATVEGKVVEIADSLSQKLWQKRDYHAQIAAWALESINNINVENLEVHKREAKKRFQSCRPPLAHSWKGYAIEPDRIEFWDTDWKKNKKKKCLTKVKGEWQEVETY